MTIFKLPQWGEKIAKKKWNRTLVWLLRVALGCTFMFSGPTKAIDPWGGFYKFAEYCNVYGFESLGSASLGLSFALAALEFMLGAFVLTGAFRRGAPVLLIGMMAVMLPAFFLGMYEKNGQPLEKLLSYYVQSRFLRPKISPYKTNNYYAILKKGGMPHDPVLEKDR